MSWFGCEWNLYCGLMLDLYLCCRQEIRTSTSSMTSVPKPLKFLRPHYGTLKAFYETMPESDLKVLFGLFVSVLNNLIR